MATVTKKGQKFIVYGEVYTVKSFFGGSGYEYNTVEEAIEKNKKRPGMICVKIKETGGACSVKDTQLIKD